MPKSQSCCKANLCNTFHGARVRPASSASTGSWTRCRRASKNFGPAFERLEERKTEKNAEQSSLIRRKKIYIFCCFCCRAAERSTHVWKGKRVKERLNWKLAHVCCCWLPLSLTLSLPCHPLSFPQFAFDVAPPPSSSTLFSMCFASHAVPLIAHRRGGWRHQIARHTHTHTLSHTHSLTHTHCNAF